MRLLRLVMLGVCLVVLAFADAGLRPRLAKPGADAKAPAPAAQSLSPQEWRDIAEAMRPVRPEQFKVLDKMSGGPQRDKARQLIADQYRRFMSVDPALREALVDEAKAQDHLFGAQLRLRNLKRVSRGARLDEEAFAEAKAGVQQAVATLFDTEIAEKKVRIARLRSEVDRLQKDVDHMEKNKTTVVDNWTNRLTGQGGRNAVEASPPLAPRSGGSAADQAEPPAQH